MSDFKHPNDDERQGDGSPARPRIKVTDRRLFDEHGNLRAKVEETPDEPEGRPSAPAHDAPPSEPVANERDAGADAIDGESGPAQPSPPEARSAADLPRDLAGFVESQYFETLLYLGAIPHPATGEVVEDTDMAQYKIDLLNMLMAKTEGNRTPEESRLFDEVLYQLRMAFLQKSKVAKI